MKVLQYRLLRVGTAHQFGNLGGDAHPTSCSPYETNPTYPFGHEWVKLAMVGRDDGCTEFRSQCDREAIGQGDLAYRAFQPTHRFPEWLTHILAINDPEVEQIIDDRLCHLCIRSA